MEESDARLLRASVRVSSSDPIGSDSRQLHRKNKRVLHGILPRMSELSPFERAFIEQLQAKDSNNPKGFLKRTSRQFVLDFGWFYKPGPLPQGVVLANEGECFNNALILALADPKLIYVEGFAALDGGPRTFHAWVTDGTGRAIDNTWVTPGVVYAGVPFKRGWVSLMGLKNKGVGSLIDDWQHDWPLLRALGDKPKTWLELEGKGFAKLT
jgi:hypothetical protein